MSINYITSFLDIGRDTWTRFSRTFDEYLNDFSPCIHLFRNAPLSHRLYVFMDEKYISSFLPLVDYIHNIRVIKISKNWLEKYSKIWNLLDKEISIMKSDKYTKLLKNRLNYPEHSIPEYTMINHVKIDLVSHIVKNLENYTEYIPTIDDYYVWVDFGYFKKPECIPNLLLDIDKLDTNRINYTLINPLNYMDRNIVYTLKTAPEKISGGFFFGRGDKILEYRDIYYNTLVDFQNEGYADDDQHLVLRCYYRYPDMFKFYHLGGHWLMAFKFFQLDEYI